MDEFSVDIPKWSKIEFEIEEKKKKSRKRKHTTALNGNWSISHWNVTVESISRLISRTFDVPLRPKKNLSSVILTCPSSNNQYCYSAS